MRTRTIARHFTLEDRAVDAWPLLPFDLAPGERALEVVLDVDRTRGVVDLGCVGPGDDGAPTAWRGWSGAARDRFAITADDATPGYLPGELAPGEWAVVLGLHHLPAEGLDVTVTVTTGGSPAIEREPSAPRPEAAPRGSARGLPAADGWRWVAADLHAHTLHSDGALSVRQLAALAAREGLDVLAITDHNTTSHHRHLPRAGAEYGVHLLPGQEVTTPRGHANAFGDIGWIDFREPADTWFRTAAERGGVASVNHPLAADRAWQHPLALPPDCMEIFHSTWLADRASTAPWALWPRWPCSVPIGGSDFHRPGDRLARPTTWLAVPDGELTDAAVIDALRSGRTAVSLGVRDAVLLRVGDELRAVGADGATLVDADGHTRVLHGDHVRLRADATAAVAGVPGAGWGPYRLETADREILAITP
ncbi:CehA/McbA family metallohydrolase [Georgenia faecalis]|uniref:CehA/McbA family metallohydrolase n=1 Tax=Georgenia faecalis TaxID=2483799 RepID=A0ABV9DD37_9MICO|nr:CehA/McbA family metallohydrolase [Georgenia faecalis]